MNQLSVVKCGMQQIDLDSWSELDIVIDKYLTDATRYIWRGHWSYEWFLRATLHRAPNFCHARLLENDKWREVELQHLQSFKAIVRSQKDHKNEPTTENEWWALGQVYGLKTPLLDWSTVPQVALYFAFDEPSGKINDDRDLAHLASHHPLAPYHVVFVLDKDALLEAFGGLQLKNAPSEPFLQIVQHVDSLSRRIDMQAGVFTRLLHPYPLETYMRRFLSEQMDRPILRRILIPSQGRDECLQYLDSLNINVLQLFPDLHGACATANNKLPSRLIEAIDSSGSSSSS